MAVREDGKEAITHYRIKIDIEITRISKFHWKQGGHTKLECTWLRRSTQLLGTKHMDGNLILEKKL